MKLYHGTNVQFTDIDIQKSQRYKDFGQAFYLSDIQSQAQDMAGNKADLLGGDAIVQQYEVPDNILLDPKLKVKVFSHYCTEWALFVWNNRDKDQEFHHDYDIVYGPIANDTIGAQMRAFRLQKKDLNEFLEGLKYVNGETYQYAFCTPRAISKLRKL